MADWRSALESTFRDGSNGTPLVGGEVFGVKRRDLERVAFRDFIVVLVLDDFDVVLQLEKSLMARPYFPASSSRLQ